MSGNTKKQLLGIQADDRHAWEETESNISTEGFLLERPLLAAIRATDPVVLLIDEVDRVEVETEALLLLKNQRDIEHASAELDLVSSAGRETPP